MNLHRHTSEQSVCKLPRAIACCMRTRVAKALPPARGSDSSLLKPLEHGSCDVGKYWLEEESEYDRYLRLDAVPRLGGVQLQDLDPAH